MKRVHTSCSCRAKAIESEREREREGERERVREGEGEGERERGRGGEREGERWLTGGAAVVAFSPSPNRTGAAETMPDLLIVCQRAS